MSQLIREVNPGELRLPPSRASGADPWKLHQQIRQFGSSRTGMPPILVYEDPDGILEISRRSHPSDPDSETGTRTVGPDCGDWAISPEPGRLSMREGSAVSEIEIRADVFTALQALSEVIPDMRTGQLLAAVGELCADIHGRGLWDATDAELLEAVWRYRRNYEAAVTPAHENATP
jgi:hypothetical protein